VLGHENNYIDESLEISNFQCISCTYQSYIILLKINVPLLEYIYSVHVPEMNTSYHAVAIAIVLPPSLGMILLLLFETFDLKGYHLSDQEVYTSRYSNRAVI